MTVQGEQLQNALTVMPYKTLAIISVFSLLPILNPSSNAQIIDRAHTDSGPAASYRLEAALQPGQAIIKGKQLFSWRNTSPQPVYSLALLGEKTNAPHQTPQNEQLKASTFVAIDSIIIREGEKLIPFTSSAGMQAEAAANTPITYVNLHPPVLPNNEIQIQIDFHILLEITENERQNHRSYFAADWYPKILEISNTQLRSDKKQESKFNIPGIDDYDVYITTSTGNDVAASGTLIATEVSDSIKIFHFSAEKIHSFAWIAGSNFIETNENWGNRGIRLFLLRSHEKYQNRYLDAIRKALEFLEASFGKFPYEQLTIIDSENGAVTGSLGSQPALIFAPATNDFIAENTRFIERNIFYGSAAQYWNGLVAPKMNSGNWLLTGLAAYTGKRMMENYFGNSVNLIDYMGFRLSDADFIRLIYLKGLLPKSEFHSRYFLSIFETGQNNLQAKSALFWLSLSHYLGPGTWKQILQTYLQQWKYKRPTIDDFIEICNRISGNNVEDYFTSIFNNDNVLDYAIESLQCLPLTEKWSSELLASGKEKILSNQPAGLTRSDSSHPKNLFETSVVVIREGAFEFPVVLEVQFRDGSKQKAGWDGKGEQHHFTIHSHSEAVSATVDPDRKILLDSNLANNSQTVKSQLGDEKITTRWLFWLQNLMLLLTSFTG